jgi:Cu+-exporting ATPase
MNILKENADLTILSGDSERERERLKKLVGDNVTIHFEQSPFQKLEFIKNLQLNGKTVLMIGDGLNDSGALKQSNVAISVTDNTLNFTPASDAILNGEALPCLNQFLAFAKDAMLAIKMSFCVSLCYNAIGLYYACSGKITPLFAAILMPISSVTVIVLTVLTTTIFAKRRELLT